MPQVPILPVNLANVAVESALYGIFFVLDAATIFLMYFPLNREDASASTGLRIKRAVKKPMFLGAVFLFISITMHWIFTILRLFEAITVYKDGTAPSEYYADIAQYLYVVQSGFLGSSLIISDAMLIYRLWVIWNRSYYMIIFPCITLLGFLVCGVILLVISVESGLGHNIFGEKVLIWEVVEGVLTLCTNLYSSGMIGYRIWRTGRQVLFSGASHVRVTGSRNLQSILVIFVESALLYTGWTIIFIITYGSKSFIGVLAANCWSVMGGITFGLINVRLSLQWGKSQYSGGNTITIPPPSPRQEQSLAYPMQPMAIHISTTETRSSGRREQEIVIQDDWSPSEATPVDKSRCESDNV